MRSSFSEIEKNYLFLYVYQCFMVA